MPESWKTAMRAGLVKSLVLDKRSEIGALSHEDLDFNADRDESGNPMLSEGQRKTESGVCNTSMSLPEANKSAKLRLPVLLPSTGDR